MTTPAAAHPSVLIVGAGPVGLVLACELARRRVPFRLVDKLPTPTTESRAIIVHARSLEMFERLGALDALIDSGVRTTGVRYHADGKELARIALDTVDSPHPFSVTTAQTETERVLAERLAELGGRVERGVTLAALTQSDDAVDVDLEHADGRSEHARFGWVVGTDGAGSAVRRAIGERLEGVFKGERFLLGDVEAEQPLSDDDMHMYFSARSEPLLVFPMLGRRLRIMAQIPAGGAREDEDVSLARLQGIVDATAPGLTLSSAHWMTTFDIHHAQVPRYRVGRVLLAGDAAHVHSPAGGQGMNTGMQDAFNLGWKLALVVHGAASELLDSYHAERHPIAARVITATTQITRLATVENGFARALRNRLLHLAASLPALQRRLAEQVEETGIEYRDSPILAAGVRGVVPPGQAAPPVAGTDFWRTITDPANTDHVLVTIAADDATELAPPEGTGAKRVLVHAGNASAGGWDVELADPERRIAERFGFGRRGGTVIIRPDGYVGAVIDEDDLIGVRRYFGWLDL